uniref:Uncharacterized protein n=1 Tax=Anguilla anguilla TaxID=7936 RepID=A0A0E9U7B9_ANGAN
MCSMVSLKGRYFRTLCSRCLKKHAAEKVATEKPYCQGFQGIIRKKI